METINNKKKIIGTTIGIAVGLFVAFLVKQFLFSPPSFDDAMMLAASEINKSCPIMLDQDTRLDNAMALPGNVLQYNYTLVNWIKDSIDSKSFEEYMRPLILNNVVTNPDLKIYRDNKTTLAYNYKDMNGKFVIKILITEDQYKDKE